MTAPFGPVLENALKENVQGGRLSIYKGVQVHPQFYCCVSGTSVGVAKDPVAMLFLSAGRVCVGDAITADYSNSWSPSSTIEAWDIDWGDGNTSGGVIFPDPPGWVAHPGGGYALPITYTVTLTVTDTLGATGISQVQVEVIDCTVAEIDLFAGCGDSGPWKTETGGLAWGDVAYGVLSGVKIHDIKANWFTIGTLSVEVWAATENGVYTSTAGSVWARKALPLPGVYAVEPIPVSIACSKYDPLELYVLATSAADVSWLYRTVDAGETWTYVAVGPIGITQPAGGALDGYIAAMYWDATVDNMYAGGGATFPTVTYPGLQCAGYWHNGIWDPVGEGVDSNVTTIARDNTGGIWWGGAFSNVDGFACDKCARWNGTFWESRALGGAGNPTALEMYSPYMHVARENNLEAVSRWRNWAWEIIAVTNGHPYALHTAGSLLYCGGNFTTIGGVPAARIAKWNGTDWSELVGGVSSWVNSIASSEDNLEIYVGGNFTAAGTGGGVITAYRFAVFDEVTNSWSSPSVGLEQLDNRVDAVVVSESGDVYIGGQFHATAGGTVLNHIARWDRVNDVWVPVGSGFNSGVYSLEFDEDGNLWAGGTFTQDGAGNPVLYIAMIGPGAGTPATVGRTYLTDMSADGQYIYVALIDSGNNPAILRIGYELAGLINIHVPGTGTWGGVVADPFYSNVLWMFGDFGAAAKVLVSDDWGATNDDRTDAGWNAAEVVRPLLPSAWDSRDVAIVLNFANDCWSTKDFGVTWAKQSDTVFDCDCGARDPFEPENIWIGRVDNGANHIQYSPNTGVNWAERSAGFTANAIVTALQVTK